MDSSRIRSELRLLYRAVRRALEGDGRDTAAAIAFYAFFALFPLLLVALSIAGFVLDSATAQARLGEILDRSLPGSSAAVARQLEALAAARGTLGAAGLIGLIWSASAAVGAAARAVNRSLGVERSTAALAVKLKQVGLTVVVSLGLAASVLLSGVAEFVSRSDLPLSGQFSPDTELVGRSVGFVAAALIAFSMFSILYKTMPFIATRWRDAVPGAILATVLFEIGKSAFLLYLNVATDYETVYGSLSALIVLMLWLVASAWVFLVGAEYNSLRRRASAMT